MFFHYILVLLKIKVKSLFWGNCLKGAINQEKKVSKGAINQFMEQKQRVSTRW